MNEDCAVQEPKIEQEMKHMGDCLESLRESINSLVGRMNCVLRQEPTTAGPNQADLIAKTAGGCSPFHATLKGYSRTVVEQNDKISDLLTRMEI